MRRRVFDVAGTCRPGTVVTLNGDTIPVTSFEEYMRL
jgi:hypothetical protein